MESTKKEKQFDAVKMMRAFIKNNLKTVRPNLLDKRNDGTKYLNCQIKS